MKRAIRYAQPRIQGATPLSQRQGLTPILGRPLSS